MILDGNATIKNPKIKPNNSLKARSTNVENKLTLLFRKEKKIEIPDNAIN